MIRAIIQSIAIEPVSYPLIHPFITAAGRKTRTDNVRYTLTLSNGMTGKAEASSSIAMASESQSNMVAAMRQLSPMLQTQPIERYRELIKDVWSHSRMHPTAAAAVESALWDAAARATRRPLARLLGRKNVAIETDLTFSVNTPAELVTKTKTAWRKGFRRFKIKLAGQTEADLERIAAVHRAAPQAKLVVDGNQGFHFTGAHRLVREIAAREWPVLFLEQPFPRLDLQSMARLRKISPVAIFADEAVRSPADAARVLDAGAADGINIKLAKSGLAGALDIIRITRQYKKRLAIGCMEESKLGLAASVHLACATGVFEWIDLDSMFLIDAPFSRGGFTVHGPRFSVRGIRSGIGL